LHDGRELAYTIHGTFDGKFKSQRAASAFAMVVNFLDKTLGGIRIHSGEDSVEEIAVTSKSGYFLLQVVVAEKCFLGVAVPKEEDITRIRQLLTKYTPLFLEHL
jgi:hypothetical protein